MDALQRVGSELFEKIKDELVREHSFDEEDFEALKDLPMGKVSRFAWGDVVFETGKPMPGMPYVMFDGYEGDAWDPLTDQAPGDVRIFCFPHPEHRGVIEQMLKPTQYEGHSFLLIRQRTATATTTRTPLTEKAFVQAQAREIAALVERLQGGGEEEEEEDDDAVECPACETLTSTKVDDDDKEDPDPKFCGNCGAELPVEAG